ncbi:DnaJ domain-containing protein [Oryzomicrobium sp.]|uniref:DnaJ domain-containing protein n=1 Tax=Oryzomicrobium sp. TaxID=1911578 RepID=UPI002FE155A3
MSKTLYDLLEVSSTASAETIAAAHQRLAEKYHPHAPHNQGTADDGDALNRYKAINDAFQVLSRPESRQRYDQQLASKANAAATAAMLAPPPSRRLGWVAVLLIGAALVGGWQYQSRQEAEKARALAEVERQAKERRALELAAELEKTRLLQEAAEARQQAQLQAQAERDAQHSYEVANARADAALHSREVAAANAARENRRQQQQVLALEQERQREAQQRLERDKATLRQMEYDNRRGPSYRSY